MTLSVAAVGDQGFIDSPIIEAGAVVFAATMIVTQVVPQLISYGKYGPSLTSLQFLGLLLGFAGLFHKSISGLLESSKACRLILYGGFGGVRFMVHRLFVQRRKCST